MQKTQHNSKEYEKTVDLWLTYISNSENNVLN